MLRTSAFRVITTSAQTNTSILTVSRRLLIFVFAAVYGSLLVLAGVADSTARTYNNPDDGNGDGFNPLINPGNYSPPHDLPSLFPPDAHIALAREAATDGKMDAAKQHAFNALKANPASGEAALALFDFYTRPDLYKIEPLPPPTEYATDSAPPEVPEPPPPPEAGFAVLSAKEQQLVDKLTTINDSLRPTYVTTQMALSTYWLHQGKPEKALHGWHISLTLYPETSTDIFPALYANINKPHMQETMKPYLDNPPTWWGGFIQYQREQKPTKEKP